MKGCVRGFPMLTLGWTDGASFIPLLFRHMSSADAKHLYNEINPKIDKRSNGYQARKQALSGAPEVLLWMLTQAKKLKVPAVHVLFDSWFSFPSTLIAIVKKGFHGVGRLKDTTKIKFTAHTAIVMTRYILLDALHTALHDSLHLSEVEVNMIIDAFIAATANNFRQIFIENKHLKTIAQRIL